jgi:hypothetical protein
VIDLTENNAAQVAGFDETVHEVPRPEHAASRPGMRQPGATLLHSLLISICRNDYDNVTKSWDG